MVTLTYAPYLLFMSLSLSLFLPWYSSLYLFLYLKPSDPFSKCNTGKKNIIYEKRPNLVAFANSGFKIFLRYHLNNRIPLEAHFILSHWLISCIEKWRGYNWLWCNLLKSSHQCFFWQIPTGFVVKFFFAEHSTRKNPTLMLTLRFFAVLTSSYNVPLH